MLDSMKSTEDTIAARCIYYEQCVRALLSTLGAPLDKLEFVRGSSYQKSEKYVWDVYRLASLVSNREAAKAGSEVVKQSNAAPLSRYFTVLSL
jgi:tyrosyl-tRNA synthetase